MREKRVGDIYRGIIPHYIEFCSTLITRLGAGFQSSTCRYVMQNDEFSP